MNDIINLLNKAIFQEEITPDYCCKICKSILKNSMSGLCGCQFCERCIKTYLDKGNKICPGGTDECRENEINISTISVNNVTNAKILQLKGKCPHNQCQFVDIIKKLVKHVDTCEKRIFSCQFSRIGCNFKANLENKLHDHNINDTIKHNELLCECLDQLRKKLNNNSQSESSIVENNTNSIELTMNNLQLTLESQRNEINDLKIKVTKMDKENEELKTNIEFLMKEMSDLKTNQNKPVYQKIGVQEQMVFDRVIDLGICFEWRIENCYDKIKSVQDHKLWSEPFFSKPNEYKFCLMIREEALFGINSYIDVFICLLPGPRDNNLKWPFKRRITCYRNNPVTLEETGQTTIQFDELSENERKKLQKPMNDSDKNDPINLFSYPIVLLNTMLFRCSITNY